MDVLIGVFFMGWLVSFLGQLPLGNMSITATQIRIQEGLKPAIQYMWGVVVVEMIYLRIALTGMDLVFQYPDVFNAIGWVTVVFFFVLGIFSVRSAIIHHPEKKSVLLNNNIHRFLFGLMLSAMNPAQIPFWVLWSSYLLEWKILHSSTLQYNVFTIGVGLGTITGLLAYIHGGNYIITKLNVSNRRLNIIMGIIFFIASAAQFWRIILK
jgi:threonine/homoserine/homoserine lactone efflux protein